MKKILLLVSLVCSAYVLSAQEQPKAYPKSHFALGIKGGLNFSDISTKHHSAVYNARTGYHGGIFLRGRIGRFALQPELLFSRIATSFQFDTKDYDSNYDYFTIPIILKFYLVENLHIHAGPQIGFIRKINRLLDESQHKVVEGLAAKSLIEEQDLSVVFGIGYDFDCGLNLDVRYNAGIKNMYKNSNVLSTSPQFKSQVFQISASFNLLKFGH